MEIKKEQEELIINFGVFDYSAKKISSILELKEDDIIKEMKNEKSKLNILLQKGKDMSDYVIDLKLFEQAKTGDIKALNKLDERKWDRNN